jgi:hypothetical protein
MHVMSTPEYAAREPIATSLFSSDQAVLSDEAVQRILSSKLELPAKSKLALMKFPDSQGSDYYRRYYWQDVARLKLRQTEVDIISRTLLASDQIAEVTPLPSLMTPKQLSIPILREAAVRMQADLLLVYRIGSDTYSHTRVFARDKVKVYSTCEMVLLDVRTGLVPFTRVVSRERTATKQSMDFDLNETMQRAEQAASVDTLEAASADLVEYIKSVPRKSE